MVYNLINSKKGAQGIGTLIIFIALILVAAVAAGVLISTVGKLQGKAETTGAQVQQKLATGFSVFEVTSNNTNDSYINKTKDTISASFQLSPGSDPIKLADVTITLVSSDGAYSYTYDSTSSTGTINTFGIVKIRGDKTDGYVNSQDVFKLNIISNAADIGENSDFTLRFFPGTGNPLPVKIVTPPSMTKKFTVLK